MKYRANTLGNTDFMGCKANDIAYILKWIKSRHIESFEICILITPISGGHKYSRIVRIEDGTVTDYNESWTIPKKLKAFIEAHPRSRENLLQRISSD